MNGIVIAEEPALPFVRRGLKYPTKPCEKCKNSSLMTTHIVREKEADISSGKYGGPRRLSTLAGLNQYRVTLLTSNKAAALTPRNPQQ